MSRQSLLTIVLAGPVWFVARFLFSLFISHSITRDWLHHLIVRLLVEALLAPVFMYILVKIQDRRAKRH